MSSILGKATNYSESVFQFLMSTKEFFNSECFVRYTTELPNVERKFLNGYKRSLLEINPKMVAVSQDLLNSTDSELICDLLKNSRKWFPENSFQIRNLKITHMYREMYELLMSLNPDGLQTLEIPYISCEIDKIFSIQSLYSLRIYEEYKYEIKSPKLRKLVVLGMGSFFDLNLVPSLETLEITYLGSTKFIGESMTLVELFISSDESVKIDLDQFPNLQKMSLGDYTSRDETVEFCIENERNQLRSLYLDGGFSLQIENCSFGSLNTLSVQNYNPVFNNCKNLRNIELQAGNIDFSNLTKLENIIIGEKVTTDYNFSNLHNLEILSIYKTPSELKLSKPVEILSIFNFEPDKSIELFSMRDCCDQLDIYCSSNRDIEVPDDLFRKSMNIFISFHEAAINIEKLSKGKTLNIESLNYIPEIKFCGRLSNSIQDFSEMDIDFSGISISNETFVAGMRLPKEVKIFNKAPYFVGETTITYLPCSLLDEKDYKIIDPIDREKDHFVVSNHTITRNFSPSTRRKILFKNCVILDTENFFECNSLVFWDCTFSEKAVEQLSEKKGAIFLDKKGKRFFDLYLNNIFKIG